ncbi:thiamine phosphate synthase [Rubrivirga sp. S365]|uniref:Thiamine-phosphate synthase n=1 Tax=Rubrivirga litoralis TaxID=3075598 RepID=A0ABU3BNA7_9BACT|nr:MULTISPECIES: thiamine phosphate synthase [unclassified Rubrivirga]MDT0630777.1 thiamine phosphate synthase [Rubrivirga sp. F394]MDT7856447.1 thiamine phosphate synthase [Rubrivirga sp. S365]
MTPTPPVGRLHVLTDFHFQQRWSHAELARQAAAGGAETVQFRHKTGTTRDRLAGLLPTVAACRAAGVPCLVDDHLDLALAAGAAGVHLGALDLPVADARAVLDGRGGGLIGATATTAEAARAAEAAGASYVGFGPVFPTGSKANPASVKGLDGLARAAAAVRIPVIAIAGVTPERVGPCLDAGAWGVAVMTAVTTAPDVEAAAARFREAVERWQ